MTSLEGPWGVSEPSMVPGLYNDVFGTLFSALMESDKVEIRIPVQTADGSHHESHVVHVVWLDLPLLMLSHADHTDVDRRKFFADNQNKHIVSFQSDTMEFKISWNALVSAYRVFQDETSQFSIPGERFSIVTTP